MPYKVNKYVSDDVLILVKEKGKHGFVGIDGQFIIDPIFEDANHFESYEAKVTKGDKPLLSMISGIVLINVIENVGQKKRVVHNLNNPFLE